MNIEIWLQFGFAGLIAMLAGKVFDLLRDMTRREADSDKHDHAQVRQAGENVTALTAAIQMLAASNQAFTTYLEALTRSLTAVNATTSSTNELVSGARREMQQYVGGQVEQQQWLKTEFPRAVANAVSEEQRPHWNMVRQKLESIALQASSLCLWVETQQQIDQGAKSNAEPAPETPETKPEPDAEPTSDNTPKEG